MKNVRVLILLHGYGVRSFFWEPIITFFESKFPQIYTPDLQMDNPTVLLESTKKYILDIKQKANNDIYLVGHSLGGVVASLVCQELGADIIKKVVFIAVPYGEQKISFKSLTKILIKYQLIPNFISRPRFFSKNTPKSVQKKIFKQVVPESEAMIDEILKEKYFHTDLLKGPLTQESLFFISESDKVVPFNQSQKMAEILGSKVILYKKDRKIGHNDYITGPVLSKEVSEKIIDFFIGKNWD